MRSPAETASGSGRLILERLGSAGALGLLAWLLFRFLAGAPPEAGVRVRAEQLPAALGRWSTVERPASVHAVIDGDIAPAAVDWLAALARAGTPVSWETSAAPVALIVDPVADPAGGVRALAAVPAGAQVALDDAFGPLDSIAAGPAGAGFLIRSGPAWVRARSGLLAARAALPDSLVFGRLLVLGKVGWESKFVVAALEERGWSVDLRLALAPGGDVAGPGATSLDTSRYSAVIVLDSVAPADLGGIASYLHAGGGVILASAALRAPALAPLSDARSPMLPAVEPFDTASADPRASLALVPIAARSGQVALESRGGRAAVVARRVDRGRLIVVGYQDTWRWRMAGGGAAVEGHRDWWAGLVAAVANVGRVSRAPRFDVDEVPLSHLADRLGPASPAAKAGLPAFSVPNGVLFAAMAGLFLLAWLSRRLRGAP
ncbi:MAG TPA: hypothetical protein VFU23_11050 [Gemmatimonadales bacterium]|nr:hypothetical protein [Gemmatimonadales bacterium]